MDCQHSNSITLDEILDLLSGAGYVDAPDSDVPASEKIAAGLSWCIAAITDDDDNMQSRSIDESLRLVGCPHPLGSSHVEDLDTEALFPVIQWLTSHLSRNREQRGNEVCLAENTIEVDECRASIETLSGSLNELVGEMDMLLDMKLASFL